MGEPKISHAPKLYLSIAGGDDVGHMFDRFEWQSFVNGGFVIRAKVHDPYWNILKKFCTEFYLQKGRRVPTPVIYEASWPGSHQSTGRHLAYMTDLDARGINAGGLFEFIAVDPPSYWLNAGDSSGRAYTGTVKDVIEQVIMDYFVTPNGPPARPPLVSKTLDTNKKNTWWMHRMDPKTFIMSLIDWSASITEKKTSWIVSSGGSYDDGPQIQVQEQAVKETKDYGLYVLDVNTPTANDIADFQFLSDNFISVFQKQLITHGISSTTERFFDRKTDPQRQIVHVRDENTGNKKNVNINDKQGFAKPGQSGSPEKPHEWSTAVMAVPEHNAGDLGLTYDKYIDGRARTLYMNMLNLVMRIKIRVVGEASDVLADSHNLGVSKLKVAWYDADNQIYFLHGDWLVYGFHHTITRGDWDTDIYCARLDYDAAAQKV